MESLRSGFPSANRLNKAAEYSHIFSSPYRSVDQQFIILAKPNKLPQARLGLAISKKRINRAVDRNKVKRLVRESFRQRQTDMSGMDMVVMVQKRIAVKQNRLLTDSLDRHWSNVAQCAR